MSLGIYVFGPGGGIMKTNSGKSRDGLDAELGGRARRGRDGGSFDCDKSGGGQGLKLRRGNQQSNRNKCGAIATARRLLSVRYS